MGHLSNIATPRYYGRFRERVLDGQVPVNQEVSMVMNRIDALIANRGVYYDAAAVEGWIRFCDEHAAVLRRSFNYN